jgi:DnaK suppressor protein
MQDEQARELLTEQLRRTEADTRTEERDTEPADGSEPGDEVMDVGDAGAQASESMDRDLALGTLRRRQEQLQAALVRLDDGTFGTCRTCGARIDDERLEVRPETEFCRDHAA